MAVKFIYTVRFENIQAFSSPRKAIEHAQKYFDGYRFSFDWLKDGDGKPLNEIPTEKLIAELNKNFGILAYDSTDQVEITKTIIQ